MNEFLYNRITDILEENNIHINEFIQYAQQKQKGDKKTMKTYQERKEEARNEAIEWQREAGERCLSYGELAEACEHFTKLAKRYGLVEEFKENGII